MIVAAKAACGQNVAGWLAARLCTASTAKNKKAAETKAKQAAAARAKAMSVRVTEASDRFNMKSGTSDSGTTSSSPHIEQVVGVAYAPAAKPAVPSKQEAEDESENLTAAQWRAQGAHRKTRHPRVVRCAG